MFDTLIQLGNLPVSEEEIVKRVLSGEDLRLINLNIVRKNYQELKEAFSYAAIYAAVKANSEKGILEVLKEEGSNFEVATVEEVWKCISKSNVKKLLKLAKGLGLVTEGIAFHVGTQREELISWDSTIEVAASIFREMANEEGMRLTTLDVGGGFPARYKDEIPMFSAYGVTISDAINKYFAGMLPKEIIIEPGRAISAMAGATIGRVINVKQSEHDDSLYIVTLSTGRMSAGLVKEINIAINIYFYRKKQYDDTVSRLSDEFFKNADMYGKDGGVFLIEKPDVRVPVGLKSGDIIVLMGTGAYCGQWAANQFCGKYAPTTIIFDDSKK